MSEPAAPGGPARVDPPAAAGATIEAPEGGGEDAGARDGPGPAPEPPPAAPGGIADGSERRLDPRHVTVQRLVGWITAGIVAASVAPAAILLVVIDVLPFPAKAAVAAAALIATAGAACAAHFWPPLSHRHASYRVSPDGIEIRRGVVWREILDVPRSRVQHTDVSQGPLQRAHGLATLVVYTAGSAYARVEMGGLDRATALEIRTHLLQGGENDAV